jgi:thiol-disulfide isomerase/thioredoxin
MRRPLIVLALALASACATGRPALARSWILGKPLDLGATSLSGDAVAVGGADGRIRAVVVWATWCRSCYELFPALDVLAAGAEGRGISIQAIAVDEDPEKVREALGRLPPRIRVLWDKGAERLGERLGVEELPTVLLLDRAGVVRFVHEGSDERLVEQIDAEIRGLLRE